MAPFPALPSPAILSPMAGVTDVAFRTLCRRYGAGLTCTEFVSSAGLVRENAATKRMLVTDPSERPVAVQLFGANEDEVVAAARRVEDDFDVIDINCGCPAWKVIKTGAGSALLNDPERIASLIKRLVAAVRKPVTVKIRAGIETINAVEVARAVEAAGAAAIAVHGRTQKQGYRGLADWGVVKAVKEAVTIPVIGNGDVFTAQEFVEKRRFSGCDYIMIARGAIGNPFIFKHIKAALEGKAVQDPTPKERCEAFFEYLDLAAQYEMPFAHSKHHAMSFTKGMPGAARLREQLTTVSTPEELKAVMRKL